MNNPAHPATLTEGMERITLKAIIPSLTNPRQTFADMAELIDSIKQHGVIQPVLVRPLTATQAEDRNTLAVYELVCGGRRFRAAHEAQLDEIPAVIRDLTDAQAMELQIIENLQRKDVSEIEEAEGYQAMMDDHGYSADDLAARIGKSRGYIYGRLKLLDLCPAARKATLDGTLSPSVALLVARIPVPSLQERALKEVLLDPYSCEPMSARKAKQHITDRYTLSMTRARHDLDSVELIPAAGACNGCAKRTSCNRDTFPDITADVCTDPDCFAAKDAAHAESIRERHLERGNVLLSYEDSNRHLHYNCATTLSSASNLIDLNGASDINEDKTWREILEGTEAQLTVLENSRNEFVECITRTALKAALIKAGLRSASAEDDNDIPDADQGEDDSELEHNRNQLSDPKNDAWRQAQEARQARDLEYKNNKLTHTALRPLIIGKLSDRLAAGQHAFDEDASLITRILLTERFEWDSEELRSVIKRHMPQVLLDDALNDIELDDEALLAASLACIDSMFQADMFALLLDLALWLHCEAGFSTLWANTGALNACATRYGIDAAMVRAEATGEPIPAAEIEAPDTLDAEPASTPDTAAQAQETGTGLPEEAQQEEPLPAPQEQPSAKPSGNPPAKYANPSNPSQTWTGRGRKPVWVMERLTQGDTLESLEIKAATAAKAHKGKAKSSGRKAAGSKTKQTAEA